MFRSTLLVVSSVVLCTVSLAAEMVANPSYQMWAKYKPGTTVTYAQEMQMPGPMPIAMTMEMTQTLKEVTAEQAVVDLVMSNSMMPGRNTTQQVVHKAQVEKTQAEAPVGVENAQVKEVGREKVKVKEKEYDCKVTEFTGTHQGMKSNGKTWTSGEVPGGMVKMEMSGVHQGDANTPQMTMNIKMNLKSFEVK